MRGPQIRFVADVLAGQSPPSSEVLDGVGECTPFIQGNAEFGLRHPKPNKQCPTASRIVARGDILLSVRAPVGALNLADQRIGIGRGLCAVRPHAVDRAFLWWFLHSSFDALHSLSTGSTYDAISGEDVGGLRLPPFNRDRQRRIAAFLDVETARIDELIDTKQQMIDRLEERAVRSVEEALVAATQKHGSAKLKYLVDEITVGIVVQPARWYAPKGVPALRGINIEPGRVVLEDLVYLSDEGHDLHSKSELRKNDVVVVRTGDAGAAAVVPEELEGANCIDLLLIRPGAYDPHLLSHAVNALRTSGAVGSAAVGTIQSHLNVGALRELELPVVPRQEQQRIVEVLGHAQQLSDETLGVLSTQIDLLEERRRSLITAAVTGEMEVP